LKLGAFDFPRRRGTTTSPLITVVMSVREAAIGIMKPSPTDTNSLPQRYRNLVPLTGLTASQVRTLCPLANQAGRIIRDDHYRAHQHIRARVEHVIARLKDWQILRQCRRRGDALNHSLQIIAGLWNSKPTSNYGSTLS